MPRNFTVSVSPNTSKTRPPSLQRVHQSDGYTFVNFDYEVADAVGYADAKYFSRVFRKHLGIRPSDFRYLNKWG